MAASKHPNLEVESTVYDQATAQVSVASLTPPRLRAESIDRAHLVDRRLASPARLGVISGPGGSGKSTLLAQCHSVEEFPAWLTLTSADNDPVHLWLSIIASIQTQVRGFGRAHVDRLLVGGKAAIDEVVPLVANELADCRSGVHLFLYDLHLVEDTGALRSIHTFINGFPIGMRVTVSSRTTAPLPLAKLRAEGQVIEFTQSDLALSDEESADVLREFGIELGPELQIGRASCRERV